MKLNRVAAERTVLAGFIAMMLCASAPSPFYPQLAETIGFGTTALTLVFGIYVLMLLVTLLMVGSFSDYVGRRPVLIAGHIVLATSMAVFSFADSLPELLVARAVQGVAAGLILATASATVIDLEDPKNPGSGSLRNAVAPLFGLAIGSAVAGAFIMWFADAQTITFVTLSLMAFAAAGSTLIVPETSPQVAGWASSLKPQLKIPSESRLAFAQGAPAMIACWATGGLYLSLAAPIVSDLLKSDSPIAQGMAVTSLMLTAGIGTLAMSAHPARSITLTGTSLLCVGTIATLVMIWLGSLAGYFVAVLIAGSGFGIAFLGVLRTIAPTSAPESRGALFSAIFGVCYLAFSLPAVIAGWGVEQFGLLPTTTTYGLIVAALAGLAFIMRLAKSPESE